MTLFDVLAELKRKGYVDEIQPHFEGQDVKKSPLSPTDYIIDEVYRIDELSDPEEQIIIYAISKKNDSKKGLIINGHGIYSDEKTNKLVQNLNTQTNQNQKPN